MSTEETAEYYSDRQRASMMMSEAAAESSIERIHLELARRYANLAGNTQDRVERVSAKPDEFVEVS